MSAESDLAVAKALSNAYAAVVEKVGSAVVGIETEKFPSRPQAGEGDSEEPSEQEFFERFFRQLPREFGDRFRQPDRQVRGIGSGVIIDRQGHILTNNHVVAEADKIRVELVGRTKIYEAEVVGRDPSSDLAVIRLKDAPADIPSAVLGDSDLMKPGNIVIAIGSPMGFKQSITTGVVSAKGRSLGEINYEQFIQTDAAINPGNSGGPLVNLDGEVIGLNTLISTRSGGSDGIGFAIPINQAKSIIRQLIASGSVTRGWLGITMNPEDAEISQALGHDGSGVLVTDVDPEGPAFGGGIQKGDLIVSFNNTLITNNDHLRYLVADTIPDEEVPVTVIRNGERIQLGIIIKAQPEDLFRRARFGRSQQNGRNNGEEASEQLGLDLSDITDSIRQRFNIDAEINAGVVITRIDPAGPAYGKPLEPGNVILELDNRPVQNLSDFRGIIREFSGDKILAYVKRGNISTYVMLNLR
jgi:serine protease Do